MRVTIVTYLVTMVMWLVTILTNPLFSSFRISGNTLYTDSLTKEDAGDYICETTNEVKTCRYTIKLKTRSVAGGEYDYYHYFTFHDGHICFYLCMIASTHESR